MCGEHEFSNPTNSLSNGSSPRVRGTPVTDHGETVEFRFIPACAGNTTCYGGRLNVSPVHPRVCGEHVSLGIDVAATDGSSPRVRGTRHIQRIHKQRLRFIPACAGNTSVYRAAAAATTVHPRVCGEHGIARDSEVAIAGSSPRVRGTPPLYQSRTHAHRFIPACAGNTICRVHYALYVTVHPRVCGEHISSSCP